MPRRNRPIGHIGYADNALQRLEDELHEWWQHRHQQQATHERIQAFQNTYRRDA